MTLNYSIPNQKILLIFFSIIVVGSTICVKGQDKPNSQPDPKEILAAAVLAAQKMKSVAYEAHFETSFPGGKSFIMNGFVEMERGDPSDEALPARLRIKGEGTGGSQEISYDGKIARRLVHDKKLLIEGLKEKGGVAVARNSPALTLLLWELIWAEPLKFERAATAMEYIGTASLKGVICHVIDLQYTVPGTGIRGARWWFAVEDKLPRRYQKVDHLPAGKIMSEFTVSNLRLENTIAATAFAMELPNGYSFQRFTPGASPQPIVVGEAAPDWKLLDKSGREQKLSDNKGKIVVLMFWASWCGYCKLAIPGIQKIYEKYKGRNVEVFGINVQEDEGIDPSDYLKSVKADFPTLLKGDKTGDSYKVKSVPGFYVIDQTVKVVYGKLLFNNSVMSEIEDAIESALNKSKN